MSAPEPAPAKPCLSAEEAMAAGAEAFQRDAAGKASPRKYEQIAALLAAARKPETKDVA